MRSALVLGVVGFALLFTCCSAGRHYEVPSDEFLRLAMRPIGSVHDSRFIGATEHRAYLAVWSGLPSIAGGGCHVHNVDLEDLPPDIAQQIRSGVNPWPR